MLDVLDIRSWSYILVDNVAVHHYSLLGMNKLDYRQPLYTQHLVRMVMECMDWLDLCALQRSPYSTVWMDHRWSQERSYKLDCDWPLDNLSRAGDEENGSF